MLENELKLRNPARYIAPTVVYNAKNRTNMRYILGNPLGMTIDQVIELGNIEHFSKLTCSIIPTIDYWKNLSNKILTDIIADDYNICFEYPVKSIKNATSSYTDIMLISDKTNIAIESKWTEKIGDYCKNQKSKRKNEVQQHWINIISKYIDKALIIEQFSDIEYQLLHRVASACSLNRDNCIVTYQIFYKDLLSDSFIKEIVKLISILDSKKIRFYVDSVKLDFTDTYLILSDEIKDLSKKKRIDKIKDTIKQNDLFIFSDESLCQL